MCKKAVIAMSGGVDSSVAAALALEHGFNCVGITLKLYKDENRCFSLSGVSVNDAKKTAFSLGIEYLALDFTEEFDKQVISRFAEAYERGATPNPCIECNRYIKFNTALLHTHLRTHQIDFDILVTGHYARIFRDSSSGRFLLQKALDEKKDQSYVLYSLTQKQLEKASFPLGGLTKNQVREIAGKMKFHNASKDESQDICFVPDGNYGDFIERYTGRNYPSGNIIDVEGKIIGRHRGIIRYTIGQRRGLGVAANVPLYVAAKSASDNTVTLAEDSVLYGKSLTAKKINLISCPDINKPIRVTVKTRYLQTAQGAAAEQTGEDTLRIEFDKPQRAITPGQAAVMYDGDIVVGGGTIT
jgi:tRNA-specific 2-thiouridylase